MSFILRLCFLIFSTHTLKASFSFSLLRRSVSSSAGVAIRITHFNGWITFLSSTSWVPSTTYPYSTPLAVSTITWSPVLISFSPGLK